MKIGIDFDNTIIDYDRIFIEAANAQGWTDSTIKDKLSLKRFLLKSDGNDQRWQFLQKEVYGYRIKNADIFPGVFDFIRHQIQLGHWIYIVSHKSEFSHYDNQTPLISPALAWLKASSLIGKEGLLLEQNVFFCPTRNEKIEKIAELKCDVFVDDLKKVLLHPDFPPTTFKIHFSDQQSSDLVNCRDWYQINTWVQLRKDLSHEGMLDLLCHISAPETVKPCCGGGNHRSYVINQSYFIKLSVSEKIDRLEHEYKALKLLRQNGIKQVPQPVYFSAYHGYLVQSYIHEKHKNQKNIKIGRATLKQVADFVKQLEGIGYNHNQFLPASQARNSLADYPSAIEQRLKNILTGIDEMYQQYPALLQIKTFIEQRFTPIYSMLLDHFLQQVDELKTKVNESFLDQEIILSPSDMGFHNMIEQGDGQLIFVDFEYFGWDDKVKLVCDFIHHEGHQLSHDEQLIFLNQLKNNHYFTQKSWQRLQLVVDFIGMEWILIVLNLAQSDKLKQKIVAFPELSVEEMVVKQIEKASKRLDAYQTAIEQRKTFFTLATDELGDC